MTESEPISLEMVEGRMVRRYLHDINPEHAINDGVGLLRAWSKELSEELGDKDLAETYEQIIHETTPDNVTDLVRALVNLSIDYYSYSSPYEHLGILHPRHRAINNLIRSL